MDTFMDKLAQRFTAQEMIDANAAADAEEMDQLKNQVQEYSECLNRMQELCVQMEQTAGDAQAKIDAAKVDGGEIERLVEAGIKKIQEIQRDTETLEALREELEDIRAAQGSSDENVHRECVRTYRNVQAVLTEESSKQTDNLLDAIKGLKGKMKGIMGVSIAALVFSLLGIVFQILIWLQVL